MFLSIVVGALWGLVASALHTGLLVRGLGTLRGGKKGSFTRLHMGSLARIFGVGALLAGGVFIPAMRMDAALVAFGAGHLFTLLRLGLRYKNESACMENAAE